MITDEDFLQGFSMLAISAAFTAIVVGILIGRPEAGLGGFILIGCATAVVVLLILGTEKLINSIQYSRALNKDRQENNS